MAKKKSMKYYKLFVLLVIYLITFLYESNAFSNQNACFAKINTIPYIILFGVLVIATYALYRSFKILTTVLAVYLLLIVLILLYFILFTYAFMCVA